MKAKLKHLAIILDGNRRYAKKHKLMLLKGHEYGAKKVEKLFDWCIELGIKELTLYVFSLEPVPLDNFNLEWIICKSISLKSII